MTCKTIIEFQIMFRTVPLTMVLKLVYTLFIIFRKRRRCKREINIYLMKMLCFYWTLKTGTYNINCYIFKHDQEQTRKMQLWQESNLLPCTLRCSALTTRARISQLVTSLPTSRQQVVFALLDPSCRKVCNKLLTICNNVDIIIPVARLFQQV